MNIPTKSAFLSGLAALSAILYLGDSRSAFADESRSDQQVESSRGSHLKARLKAFRMGVCVGQTLADEDIFLPSPEAGRRPNLDSETKEALKNAIKECRNKLTPGDSSEDQSTSDSSSSEEEEEALD